MSRLTSAATRSRLLALLLLVTTFTMLTASAQSTDDAKELLRDGLFEEEANRNLTAAIDAYEKVVALMDEQRELAATAIFRLGECYRKQGDNERAAAQYRRILDEFADQPNLAVLSHQNLNAIAGNPATGSYGFYEIQPGDTILRIAHDLGTTTNQVHTLNPGLDPARLRIGKIIRVPAQDRPEVVAAGSAVPSAERAEYLRLKSILDTISALNAPNSREEYLLLGEHFPQSQIRDRLFGLDAQELQLAELKVDKTELHDDVKRARARMEVLQQTLASIRDSVLKTAETRMAVLEKMPGVAPALESTTPAAREAQIALLKEEIALLESRLENWRGSSLPVEISNLKLQTQRDLLATKRQLTVLESFDETGADAFGRGSSASLTTEEQEELLRIEALAKRSPDLLSAPDENGLTPLHHAAKNGYLEVVKRLVAEGADVSAGKATLVFESNRGMTPLHFAAFHGHQAIIEVLLGAGADVDASVGNSPTPLHWAAYKGFLSIVEVLVRSGASLKSTTENPAPGYNRLNEMTPLHLASGEGHLAVARFLVEKGANVDPESGPVSPPPIYFAVKQDHPSLVQFLLENGASVNYVRGGRAESYEADRPRERGDTVRFNHNDIPILHDAVAIGIGQPGAEVAMVKLLLPHVDDINLPDSRGQTPLRLAVAANLDETAMLLLKAGAEVNAGRSGKYGGPLFQAVNANKPELVEALLEAGASIEMEGGRNPLVQAGVSDVSLLKLILSYQPDALSSDMGREAIEEAILSHPPGFLEVLIQLDSSLVVRVANENGALWRLAEMSFQSQDERDPVEVKFGRLLQIGVDARSPYDVSVLGRIRTSDVSPVNTPPLIPAAWRGNVTLVKLLLEAGADANYLSRHLDTAYSLVQGILGTGDEVDRGAPSVNGSSFQVRHRRASRFVPAEQTAYEEVLSLLVAHGADPYLHRVQRISVSRSANDFEEVVFWRDEADWSDVSLFELLNESFTVKKGNLDFPDFSRIVIHRLDVDSGHDVEIPVAVLDGLMTGDCSADVPLMWGDRVEIPEAVHAQNERWQRTLLPEIEATLHSCVSRSVTLVTGDSERVWKLARHNPTLYRRLAKGGVTIRLADGGKLDGLTSSQREVLKTLTERGTGVEEVLPNIAWFSVDFELESFLEASRQLLTNSDLTRVEVTRTDKVTGEVKTHVFDASGAQSPRDLWLEDGDVIRVPSK